MTHKPKMALLGSGPTAEHHVRALSLAGFDVACVASRLGSTTVENFARKMSIDRVFSDPWDMIDSPDWDALCVAVTPNVTWQYVQRGLESGRWVLSEKPLFTSAKQSAGNSALWRRLAVGYNRRFYPNVREARQFIMGGSPCVVRLDIPESVMQVNGLWDYSAVKSNAVHMIDLGRFLVGDVELLGIDACGSDEPRPTTMRFASKRGDLLIMHFNWNSPANFGAAIERSDERIELRPVELLRRYKGMDIVEPSSTFPTRRYLPHLVHELDASHELAQCKPGFFEQSQEFYDLVTGVRKSRAFIASAEDALEALRVAELAVRSSQGANAVAL